MTAPAPTRPSRWVGRGRRKWLAIGAVALVALLGAGTAFAWYFGLIFTNPSARGGAVAVPAEAVETVATGLEVPWALAFLPDGTALVTERNSGRILSVTAPAPGTVASNQLAAAARVTEVARITDVAPRGEGGLLGIAVSPDYASDRWVYVYYTAAEDNRIVRLRLGETPQPIVTGIPKASIHNGGRIAFGPDGMLYVGTGRRERAGRVAGHVVGGRQDPADHAGGQTGAGQPVREPGLLVRSPQRAGAGLGRRRPALRRRVRAEPVRRAEPDRGRAQLRLAGGRGHRRQPAFVNPIATWSTSDASPSGLAIMDGRAYLACLRGTKLYRIGLDGTGAQQLLSTSTGGCARWWWHRTARCG